MRKTPKKRTRGEMAAGRASDRVIHGEHLAFGEQMSLDSILQDEGLLHRLLPDERSPNYVPWDKMTPGQRARVLAKHKDIYEQRARFTIPVEPDSSLSKDQAHEKKMREWERRLMDNPLCHDADAHPLLDNEPDGACLWWWDQRSELFLGVTPFRADPSFVTTVLRGHGRSLRANTSWTRFKTIASRLCDTETGKARSAWNGKRWGALSRFMRANYGDKQRAVRIDVPARILYVCYAVEKGGMYHGVLALHVRTDGSSLKELAKQVDKLDDAIVDRFATIFPVKCPCAFVE